MTDGIIAVTEEVQTAGAIVWWRLDGAVSAEAFARTWTEAGVEGVEPPNPPTPRRALARAVRSVAAGLAGVLARPTRTGWALVREDERVHENGGAPEEDLEYGVIAIARVSDVDPVTPRVRVTIRDAEAEAQWGLRMRLTLAFDDVVEALSPRDLSVWLTRRVTDAVGAVSLREAGGVYFVPRTCVDTWGRVAEALGRAGAGRFFRIPAMRSAEAVEAISDAMTREAEAAASEVETELSAGELGRRALESRKARLEALRGKVRAYEGVLKTPLAQVTERLQHIEAAVAEAAIAAVGAEEA